MAPTLEKVASDALGLSSAGRAKLVEKLLASLEGESDPAVERTHLDEVRARRAAVGAGQSQLVDGEVALQRARAAMRQ